MTGDPGGPPVSDAPRFCFADGISLSHTTIDLFSTAWTGAFQIGTAPSYLPCFEPAWPLNGPSARSTSSAGIRREPVILQNGNAPDLSRLPDSDSTRPEKRSAPQLQEKIADRAVLEAKAAQRFALAARQSFNTSFTRTVPGKRPDDPRAGPRLSAGARTA